MLLNARWKDATVLDDPNKRVCAKHNDASELPPLAAFGAGFSCTSYSHLNKDSKKNATAMHKDPNDPEVSRIESSSQYYYSMSCHV